MSKSLEFGRMAANRTGVPGDAIYRNGFTATTFSGSLPAIRDNRTMGEFAAIEVYNEKMINGKICRSFTRTVVGVWLLESYLPVRLWVPRQTDFF